MKNEKQPKFKERRKDPRKACLISVNWGMNDSFFTNNIQNISNGGLFIETKEFFPVGQEVSLKILAPSKIRHDKKIISEVVKSDEKGIALKFKNIDQQQDKIVKTLIENI